MKYFIKTIALAACISFCLFSEELPALAAEETHTAVKIELVKPILPGELPGDPGNTGSKPKDSASVLPAKASTASTSTVKRTTTGVIVKSRLGKLLPKNGEEANSWSMIGWGILLFLLLMVSKKKARKDTLE